MSEKEEKKTRNSVLFLCRVSRWKGNYKGIINTEMVKEL